jgi:hypothetical protein
MVKLVDGGNSDDRSSNGCEYCGGHWLIESRIGPDLLEGACMDCQADSDAEKPLTFRAPSPIERMMEPDPKVLEWTTAGKAALARETSWLKHRRDEID